MRSRTAEWAAGLLILALAAVSSAIVLTPGQSTFVGLDGLHAVEVTVAVPYHTVASLVYTFAPGTPEWYNLYATASMRSTAYPSAKAAFKVDIGTPSTDFNWCSISDNDLVAVAFESDVAFGFNVTAMIRNDRSTNIDGSPFIMTEVALDTPTTVTLIQNTGDVFSVYATVLLALPNPSLPTSALKLHIDFTPEQITQHTRVSAYPGTLGDGMCLPVVDSGHAFDSGLFDDPANIYIQACIAANFYQGATHMPLSLGVAGSASMNLTVTWTVESHEATLSATPHSHVLPSVNFFDRAAYTFEIPADSVAGGLIEITDMQGCEVQVFVIPTLPADQAVADCALAGHRQQYCKANKPCLISLAFCPTNPEAVDGDATRTASLHRRATARDAGTAGNATWQVAAMAYPLNPLVPASYRIAGRLAQLPTFETLPLNEHTHAAVAVLDEAHFKYTVTAEDLPSPHAMMRFDVVMVDEYKENNDALPKPPVAYEMEVHVNRGHFAGYCYEWQAACIAYECHINVPACVVSTGDWFVSVRNTRNNFPADMRFIISASILEPTPLLPGVINYGTMGFTYQLFAQHILTGLAPGLATLIIVPIDYKYIDLSLGTPSQTAPTYPVMSYSRGHPNHPIIGHPCLAFDHVTGFLSSATDDFGYLPVPIRDASDLIHITVANQAYDQTPSGDSLHATAIVRYQLFVQHRLGVPLEIDAAAPLELTPSQSLAVLNTTEAHAQGAYKVDVVVECLNLLRCPLDELSIWVTDDDGVDFPLEQTAAPMRFSLPADGRTFYIVLELTEENPLALDTGGAPWSMYISARTSPTWTLRPGAAHLGTSTARETHMFEVTVDPELTGRGPLTTLNVKFTPLRRSSYNPYNHNVYNPTVWLSAGRALNGEEDWVQTCLDFEDPTMDDALNNRYSYDHTYAMYEDREYVCQFTVRPCALNIAEDGLFKMRIDTPDVRFFQYSLTVDYQEPATLTLDGPTASAVGLLQAGHAASGLGGLGRQAHYYQFRSPATALPHGSDFVIRVRDLAVSNFAPSKYGMPHIASYRASEDDIYWSSDDFSLGSTGIDGNYQSQNQHPWPFENYDDYAPYEFNSASRGYRRAYGPVGSAANTFFPSDFANEYADVNVFLSVSNERQGPGIIPGPSGDVLFGNDGCGAAAPAWAWAGCGTSNEACQLRIPADDLMLDTMYYVSVMGTSLSSAQIGYTISIDTSLTTTATQTLALHVPSILNMARYSTVDYVLDISAGALPTVYNVYITCQTNEPVEATLCSAAIISGATAERARMDAHDYMAVEFNQAVMQIVKCDDRQKALSVLVVTDAYATTVTVRAEAVAPFDVSGTTGMLQVNKTIFYHDDLYITGYYAPVFPTSVERPSVPFVYYKYSYPTGVVPRKGIAQLYTEDAVRIMECNDGKICQYGSRYCPTDRNAYYARSPNTNTFSPYAHSTFYFGLRADVLNGDPLADFFEIDFSNVVTLVDASDLITLTTAAPTYSGTGDPLNDIPYPFIVFKPTIAAPTFGAFLSMINTATSVPATLGIYLGGLEGAVVTLSGGIEALPPQLLLPPYTLDYVTPGETLSMSVSATAPDALATFDMQATVVNPTVITVPAGDEDENFSCNNGNSLVSVARFDLPTDFLSGSYVYTAVASVSGTGTLRILTPDNVQVGTTGVLNGQSIMFLPNFGYRQFYATLTCTVAGSGMSKFSGSLSQVTTIALQGSGVPISMTLTQNAWYKLVLPAHELVSPQLSLSATTPSNVLAYALEEGQPFSPDDVSAWVHYPMLITTSNPPNPRKLSLPTCNPGRNMVVYVSDRRTVAAPIEFVPFYGAPTRLQPNVAYTAPALTAATPVNATFTFIVDIDPRTVAADLTLDSLGMELDVNVYTDHRLTGADCASSLNFQVSAGQFPATLPLRCGAHVALKLGANGMNATGSMVIVVNALNSGVGFTIAVNAHAGVVVPISTTQPTVIPEAMLLNGSSRSYELVLPAGADAGRVSVTLQATAGNVEGRLGHQVPDVWNNMHSSCVGSMSEFNKNFGCAVAGFACNASTHSWGETSCTYTALTPPPGRTLVFSVSSFGATHHFAAFTATVTYEPRAPVEIEFNKMYEFQEGEAGEHLFQLSTDNLGELPMVVASWRGTYPSVAWSNRAVPFPTCAPTEHPLQLKAVVLDINDLSTGVLYLATYGTGQLFVTLTHGTKDFMNQVGLRPWAFGPVLQRPIHNLVGDGPHVIDDEFAPYHYHIYRINVQQGQFLTALARNTSLGNSSYAMSLYAYNVAGGLIDFSEAICHPPTELGLFDVTGTVYLFVGNLVGARYTLTVELHRPNTSSSHVLVLAPGSHALRAAGWRMLTVDTASMQIGDVVDVIVGFYAADVAVVYQPNEVSPFFAHPTSCTKQSAEHLLYPITESFYYSDPLSSSNYHRMQQGLSNPVPHEPGDVICKYRLLVGTDSMNLLLASQAVMHTRVAIIHTESDFVPTLARNAPLSRTYRPSHESVGRGMQSVLGINHVARWLVDGTPNDWANSAPSYTHISAPNIPLELYENAEFLTFSFTVPAGAASVRFVMQGDIRLAVARNRIPYVQSYVEAECPNADFVQDFDSCQRDREWRMPCVEPGVYYGVVLPGDFSRMEYYKRHLGYSIELRYELPTVIDLDASNLRVTGGITPAPIKSLHQEGYDSTYDPYPSDVFAKFVPVPGHSYHVRITAPFLLADIGLGTMVNYGTEYDTDFNCMSAVLGRCNHAALYATAAANVLDYDLPLESFVTHAAYPDFVYIHFNLNPIRFKDYTNVPYTIEVDDNDDRALVVALGVKTPIDFHARYRHKHIGPFDDAINEQRVMAEIQLPANSLGRRLLVDVETPYTQPYQLIHHSDPLNENSGTDVVCGARHFISIVFMPSEPNSAAIDMVHILANVTVTFAAGALEVTSGAAAAFSLPTLGTQELHFATDGFVSLRINSSAAVPYQLATEIPNICQRSISAYALDFPFDDRIGHEPADFYHVLSSSLNARGSDRSSGFTFPPLGGGRSLVLRARNGYVGEPEPSHDLYGDNPHQSAPRDFTVEARLGLDNCAAPGARTFCSVAPASVFVGFGDLDAMEARARAAVAFLPAWQKGYTLSDKCEAALGALYCGHYMPACGATGEKLPLCQDMCTQVTASCDVNVVMLLNTTQFCAPSAAVSSADGTCFSSVSTGPIVVPPPSNAVVQAPAPASDSSSSTLGIVLGVVFGLAVVAGLALAIYMTRRKSRLAKHAQHQMGKALGQVSDSGETAQRTPTAKPAASASAAGSSLGSSASGSASRDGSQSASLSQSQSASQSAGSSANATAARSGSVSVAPTSTLAGSGAASAGADLSG